MEYFSLITNTKSEENGRLLISLDGVRLTDTLNCFGLFSSPMFAKYPYTDLYDFEFFVALKVPKYMVHVPPAILKFVDEKEIENVFFTVQKSPATEVNFLPHTWCFPYVLPGYYSIFISLKYY